MSNLQEEFEYYLEHQEELVKKYEGKYLLIKDLKIVDVFESAHDAYGYACKHFEPGTFLIQPCLPGEESYTHIFYARASL